MEKNETLTKRVLDNLETLIYVSDPVTYEILFINRKMSEEFGGRDLTGKICWQVLQNGMDGPCPFCPNKQLLENPGERTVWEEHNTYTGRYYKNIDNIIKWDDGRDVHLQHSLDITEIKKAEQAMTEKVDSQTFLTDVSLVFASAGDVSRKIDRALEKIGKYYGADRVSIVRINLAEKSLKRVNMWIGSGVFDANKPLLLSKLNPDGIVTQKLIKGEMFSFDIKDKLSPELSAGYDEIGIKSLMMFPIFDENSFWGALSIDRGGSTRVWNDSDYQLAKILCSLMTTALERGRVEADLYNTQRDLRNILDNAAVGIFWKDLDFRYTGCNRYFAEMIEKTQDEITGKTDYDLFDRKIADIYSVTDADLIKSQRPLLDSEVQLVTASGKMKWTQYSKVPMVDKNGNIVSILCVMHDISEKKKAELDMIERDRELQRVLQIAEKSDKAKSEFLSRMSHEIRTPMNAIIGMGHIASETEDMAKIRVCLEKIDNASKNLLAIINDVLDMSKIEAGKFELTSEEFNIENMLLDISGIIGVRADEKHQNVEYNVEKDVPSTYSGDAFRLSQVVTNLLTNAVKFTNDYGEIKISISLDGISDGRATLRFCVKDNGIGIDDEQKNKLFTAFEQANGGIARKYGGTGLGLSICKRIVEMMGGSIEVNSRPGEGSSFIFTVVLDVIDKPGEKSRPNSAGLRLLYVDSNAKMREHFIYLMNENGVPVTAAASGQEALRVFDEASGENKTFSVVFIDCHLSDMNGIEAAVRIAEKAGAQNTVLLTSNQEWTALETAARAAGITHYISKPLFPSVVINIIHEIVGRNASRRGTAKKPDLGGKRILLVEDLPVNAEIVENMLENTNSRLETAVGGAAALGMFSADPNYDIILMDINMPDMDGYEATRRIRGIRHPNAASVPIIALTANVFRDDVDRCIESGMNDHIGKPVDPDKLYEKLYRYLVANRKPSVKIDGVCDLTGYLPYINVDKAIAALNGNKKLYLTMLKTFRKNKIYSDCAAALDTGDATAIAAAVKAFKAAAYNLSMDKVTETIGLLESHMRRGIASGEAVAALRENAAVTMEYADRLINELEV